MWQLVERAAADHPDRVLLSDSYGRRMTANQLAAAAETAAAGLGIDSSSVVIWQLPNSLEAVVLLLASARVGAVQAPVIPILRETEMRHISGQVGATHVVVPETWRGFGHGELGRSIADAMDAELVVLDFGAAPDGPLRLPSGDRARLPAPPDESATYRWAYFSSGTTGMPKGAKHSDESVIASSWSMTDRLGIAAGDVYPIAWPISHIGGITMLAAVLRQGGELVLFDSFDPAAFGDTVAPYRPTILGTGVLFFRSYLDAQHRRGDGDPLYPGLRVCTAGGAPTPPEIIDEIVETFGLPGVVNSWGLTEFPIACCPSPSDAPSRLRTTVGSPSPGVEIRTVDGELRLKGPQCFLGYVDPALDAGVFDGEGWFRTGDLGEVDSDGFVTITGRLKDIIIRNGENIVPSEIEQVLLSHPKVIDAAVVGIPDPRTGERAAAFVVLQPGADMTLADVQKHFVDGGVARQKTPEHLQVVELIPRNPMGKVLKDQLRAEISDQGAVAGAS